MMTTKMRNFLLLLCICAVPVQSKTKRHLRADTVDRERLESEQEFGRTTKRAAKEKPSASSSADGEDEEFWGRVLQLVSSLPTQASQFTGEPRLLDCGVPETCTPSVLDTDAKGFSCGDRMNFLITADGLSEMVACMLVAEVEFPIQCGACNPSIPTI